MPHGEAPLLELVLEVDADDARLDVREAVHAVDGEDGVQAPGVEGQDRPGLGGLGGGTDGVGHVGAATERYHHDVRPPGEVHDELDLGVGRGEDDAGGEAEGGGEEDVRLGLPHGVPEETAGVGGDVFDPDDRDQGKMNFRR